MDDERVWLYAAMMVIYFIAWVLKKIKTRSEGKNEEEAKPDRTLAEVKENRKRHLQRQAARESASDEASQALRQLFESVGGESVKESFLPEAEPASAKPPPLTKARTPPPFVPAAKKAVSAPGLTPAEQKALADLKSRQNSPYQIRKKTRSHSLAPMTRGKGLRQAVVLKEILDQPRALRPY